jgi:predicted dienelactone hydrolase
VFLQHPGSDESLWKGKQLREGLADLAAGATGEQLRERVKDVGFVLDQLAQWNTSQGHALERRLDLTRIAMSGHSFGAVTTETIMATAPRDRSKWKISACIIMSPSPFAAFASDQAFGKIDIPVLCMTGTEDENPLNRDQPPSTRLEVYKHLPPGRKYQVVFDGGNHGIFSGHQLRFRERAPRFHPAITRLTVEFLKSALLADSTSAKWLASEAPKREGVLAPGDAWMWK